MAFSGTSKFELFTPVVTRMVIVSVPMLHNVSERMCNDRVCFTMPHLLGKLSVAWLLLLGLSCMRRLRRTAIGGCEVECWWQTS
jgi:hypothetical protein